MERSDAATNVASSSHATRSKRIDLATEKDANHGTSALVCCPVPHFTVREDGDDKKRAAAQALCLALKDEGCSMCPVGHEKESAPGRGA